MAKARSHGQQTRDAHARGPSRAEEIAHLEARDQERIDKLLAEVEVTACSKCGHLTAAHSPDGPCLVEGCPCADQSPEGIRRRNLNT